MGKLLPEEKRKVRKPLLWIGLASIVMTFAGLTSGYVVSRSSLQVDNRWLEFALPEEFFWATGVILLSSFSMIWAGRALRQNNQKALQAGLFITLLLGISFALLQWSGWQNLTDRGLFFTGEGSSTSISWVYVLTFLHWLHLISGLIVLIVTLAQAMSGVYRPDNKLGFSLAAIYWHFLDGLWLYLIGFLVFFR